MYVLAFRSTYHVFVFFPSILGVPDLLKAVISSQAPRDKNT